MIPIRFITQILLPWSDIAGEPFPPELYRAFERRVFRRYGGWTKKGSVEGAWLGSGNEVYMDRHWVYEVNHEQRDLRFWRREKERLKLVFDQEDIWITQFEGRQL